MKKKFFITLLLKTKAMRKKVLNLRILFCWILFTQIVNAQPVLTNNNINTNNTYTNYTVSPSIRPLIVQHNATPGTPSDQSLANKMVMWLEYGDGGFTVNASTDRWRSNTSGKSLLVLNKLYDTVYADMFRVSSSSYSNSTATRTNLDDNDTPILNSSQSSDIHITSNVYDIVRKDTMCFALTYKIDSQIVSNPENNFYMVFLYKNNAFYDFSESQNLTGVPPSSTSFPVVTAARLFHNDAIVPAGALSTYVNNLKTSGSYDNYVIIKIGDRNKSERNAFLSLFTKPSLPSGGSTSVKAYLIYQPSSSNGSPSFQPLASHVIPAMDFRASHDPNYITQYPVCMQLPKIQRTFNYRIHFQNTGEGDADFVKVTVFLPAGMVLTSNSSVQIVNKNFAADLNNHFSYSVNQTGNRIQFIIAKQNNQSDLKGIAGLNNALVNPVTMGDIYFNVTATASVPDTMKAHASIEFHTKGRRPSDFESPVITNIATSYYSKCSDTTFCQCEAPGVDTPHILPRPVPQSHCTKFAGLCWWWWVIIALSGIVIYLLVSKKREK